MQISNSSRWPSKPYRGLDFFRESDEALFRERENDSLLCKDLLLKFGVKLLVLQGTSGCGKSSFLRAGLIPSIKSAPDRTRNNPRQCYFLNLRDVVLRCTSNPLREIANALKTALQNSDPFICGPDLSDAHSSSYSDASESRGLRDKLDEAICKSNEQLGQELIGVLFELVAELPGQLILILDQAEEVLTREDGQGASQAFFRFLENVYLQNIDVRVIISLRTEYYGRFRDELRISDDRIAERPKSGGIHSYLLHPLRDKRSLIRIIEAPVDARENGRSVYNFSYAPGLAEAIVTDLLDFFTHSAVTPALQVVCATLYSALNDQKRSIVESDYRAHGDVGGILSSYVEAGIRILGAEDQKSIDKWRLTLFSLVSRQGGGTVVSLTESLKELERRARSNDVSGDIGRAFVKLASSSTPLLRGEPPDDPTQFSLKHDILAVVLSRWYDEYGGAIRANEHVKKRIKQLSSFGAIGLAALACATVVLQGRTAFNEKARLIAQRSEYVSSNYSDVKGNLLVTLTSLDEIQRPNYWYGMISGATPAIQRKLTESLRSMLLRSPRFTGDFRSAAFDPSGRSLALLGYDGVRILHLTEEFMVSSFKLELPYEGSYTGVAIGFLTGTGLAVYADQKIFWGDGAATIVNLSERIPKSSALKIRSAQFFAGQLYLLLSEGIKLTSIIRVTSKDLTSDDILRAEPITAALERAPVFSDRTPGLYGYFGTRDDRDGSESQLSVRSSKDRDYLLRFDVPDGSTDEASLAFAANEDTAVVANGSRNIFFWPLRRETNREPSERLKVEPARRIVPPYYRNASPFAAARVNGRWRVAYLTRDSIALLEEGEDQVISRLEPKPGELLLGFPSPQSDIQFSNDGNFLLARPNWFGVYAGEDSVQVWDFRPERRAKLKAAGLDTLREESCRLAAEASRGSRLSAAQGIFLSIDSQEQPCKGW